jgi:hypothetical protein
MRKAGGLCWRRRAMLDIYIVYNPSDSECIDAYNCKGSHLLGQLLPGHICLYQSNLQNKKVMVMVMITIIILMLKTPLALTITTILPVSVRVAIYARTTADRNEARSSISAMYRFPTAQSDPQYTTIRHPSLPSPATHTAKPRDGPGPSRANSSHRPSPATWHRPAR